MNDDLIEQMAADLKPVRATALLERLALVVAGGLVDSAALMWLWLDIRPDMAEAVGTRIFWIKSSYTLVVGLLGVWAVERLSRPGGSGRAPLGGALVCFGVVAVAAVIDYSTAPEHARAELLIGSSAAVCPLFIAALAVPLLLAIIVCMRTLAPTNASLAGAAAGLAAGALGAWIYTFHCTEPSLPFLAGWYSLGIVAVTIAGAFVGNLFLRW